MGASARIFISAVSSELAPARQLVANTLHAVGYEADWQDIFGTQGGDLREVLRKKIDDCKGVIQLVGYHYGAEPPMPDEDFGRVSYTQYEARYARTRGKKVWYLIDVTPPQDEVVSIEPEELRVLQEEYRNSVRRGNDTYYEIDLKNGDAVKVAVHGLKDDLAKLQRSFRLWTRSVTILLLVIASLVVWLVFESRRAHENWVSDPFVGVRVAQQATGTILAEEPYEIKLEIRNQTTMPMDVSRIVVFSQNQEAAKLFGLPNDRVFEANIDVLYYLDGNGVTTVPVRLNQILPQKIVVQIYHNLAGAASEFRLDLGGRALPMPSPRYLSRDQIFRGYDSLVAMKRATDEACKWSPDARLVAMFPGDNAVMIDPESRLKFTVAESWVSTFYSRSLDRDFVAIISSKEVKGQGNDSHPDRDEVPSADPPAPTLGFEQALDLANRASLLSADWQGPRLGVVEIGGKVGCAWFLPYRAPDGMPVIIDAVTADQLVHDPVTVFKRVPVPAVPLRK